MNFPLPDALVDKANAFHDGEQQPAEPRNAATVVLLRPGAGSSEVYLLRRQTTMDFAAGMCVFPGGRVDERDFDATLNWVGPSRAEWADRLGVDDEGFAGALVCAAVRETFEESGVLLAGPSSDQVVADTTGADWEADRQALEGRDLAFTDFLQQRGLFLRTDLLGAWSGWLTPEFEPRRFRTWFFVAVLPDGQVTRDVSTESSSVLWQSVPEVLADVEGKRMLMLPPTYATCLEIAGHAGPGEVLAAASQRRVSMFTPQLTHDGGSWVLSSPDHLTELLRSRS